MAHLSKRLLAIAVLAVLAAVVSVEANQKKKDPRWCVARIGTNNQQLQSNLDYACNSKGVDCSYIREHGKCYKPSTLKHHASWAMNEYYHFNGAKDCNFRGTGVLVSTYPHGNGGCEFHPKHGNTNSNHGSKNSWCVAKDNASNHDLQLIIDRLCASHVNCNKIKQPDSVCYKPNNHWNHASWAMNQYYQFHGRTAAACKFDGHGIVIHNMPGSANCFPSNGPTGGH